MVGVDFKLRADWK